MFTEYQRKIENIWDDRRLLDDPRYKDVINEVIDLLDKGRLRVAERTEEGWKLNQWVKKAVILYLPSRKAEITELGPLEFNDKVPLKKG